MRSSAKSDFSRRFQNRPERASAHRLLVTTYGLHIWWFSPTSAASFSFFCKSALSRLVSPRADPAAWGQARGDTLAPLVQPQRAVGWGCLCLTTARPGSRPTLLCANVHAFRARALCTPG